MRVEVRRAAEDFLHREIDAALLAAGDDQVAVEIDDVGGISGSDGKRSGNRDAGAEAALSAPLVGVVQHHGRAGLHRRRDGAAYPACRLR